MQANDALTAAIQSIAFSTDMSEGTNATFLRKERFSSVMSRQLAGISMVPKARDYLTNALDSAWAESSAIDLPRYATTQEVVIGAGLHAAIYCAARVAAGYAKPIVLEVNSRVGGAFAVTHKPAFYLNSSNRPGMFGLPSTRGGLNYIPGGVIQPDMLSGREYQTNADMSFAIRATLAMFADVYTGVNVTNVNYSGEVEYSSPQGNGYINAGRVIDARGLGVERSADQVNGTTVLSFLQFLNRFDSMFPLEGMDTLAILGGGDSAKVATEAALGIGPSEQSLTGLDYVQNIDLYATNLPQTCSAWRKSQPRRYGRVGTYLPRGFKNATNAMSRLRVIQNRGDATATLGGALVGPRTYSAAIYATGFNLPSLGLTGFYPVYGRNGQGTQIASAYDTGGGTPVIYRVGPAADIDWTSSEIIDGLSVKNENRVSIFRLASRTAALADMLGTPSNPYL